jgi:hypothetical protein
MAVQPTPDARLTEQPDTAISRRSLLRSGGALGVSALAASWFGPARALGIPPPHIAYASDASRRSRAAHVVARYRPSEATGWPATPGKTFSMTLGGHTPARDFTFNGKPYRISLLPFDQPGNSPNPLYEGVPTDPTIDFRRTLKRAFGPHDSFRYLGGLRGRGEISVHSYGVFVQEPTPQSPGTGYGAEIYLVCNPDLHRGAPPVSGDLHWIQVISWQRTGMPRQSVVDNFWRANPFYFYGGLTSVFGKEVFNFHDVPQATVIGTATLDDHFTSEVFLAQDTGTKDATGKDLVNVLGGVKYGWQVAMLR